MSDHDCTEEWRPVVGFETDYEVSSLGRVRSFPKWHTVKGDLLKGRIHKRWRYVQVTLRSNGRQVERNIHRLVGEAFLGPLPKGLDTNHKDGNKSNNAVSNLEYVTTRENVQHAWDTGLYANQRAKVRGEANPKAKLTPELVRQIRAEAAEHGTSFGALGRKYGINANNASMIVRRLTWKHI